MHTKQKTQLIYPLMAIVIHLLANQFAPLQAQQPESSDSELVASEETETAAEEALAQVGPRALSRAFRLAARKATPAVVTILSYGQSDPARNAAARQQSQSQQGSGEPIPEPDENQLTGVGSGVIVSPEGRVITNNHVIRDAKRVVVQLFDETEIEATATAEAAWIEHNREVGDAHLRSSSASWYTGENIAGKPVGFMPYIGGMPAYRKKCDAVAAEDYEGFRFA